jgi:hypothetical protein
VGLIIRSFGSSTGRLISAIASLVGGWRSDPWPRGVQEEDRDGPWGSRLGHVAVRTTIAVLKVPLTRVRGAVSTR